MTCALQAPVFGSNFGTQGGFAGFTGVAPPKKDADGEEANAGDAEEECKAEFTPLVQLEEVEVNTGEEDEECLLELCASNLTRARVLVPTNVRRLLAVVCARSQATVSKPTALACSTNGQSVCRKCKMYRYDKDGKEWKERGIGQAKFLRSKESKKTRFLMRQEKTLKIRANHISAPLSSSSCPRWCSLLTW